MKLQLWSHFQLRWGWSGATSWFLCAQPFPTPAGPPRGDASSGAQLLRAGLSAIVPARDSLCRGNPDPLPSTSAWTLPSPSPLSALFPDKECAPWAIGSACQSRLSLHQCQVLLLRVQAPQSVPGLRSLPLLWPSFLPLSLSLSPLEISKIQLPNYLPSS